jgi:hypothetical protein
MDGLTELINTFDRRELQLEAARVVASHKATNGWIKKFKADHDSEEFYRNAIRWYVNEYGGLPSEVGPGTGVTLLYV